MYEAQCKHKCEKCAGYETTGDCNHGCFDCIHFNGNNCTNLESNYYDCHGEECAGDCHKWESKEQSSHPIKGGNNMKLNMKTVTNMYIKLLKACNDDTEECCDIENSIVNVIEENLKTYGIKKYNYQKEGGSTTDAFCYYVEKLVEKYYHVSNFFETKYWKYNTYIPYNMKNMITIENTLNNMQDVEVIRFLEWYKTIESSIVCQFDYKIIQREDISKIINEYEYDEIRISIQDFSYNFYNPVICWVNTMDIPTLFIMDWVSLRYEIGEWICMEQDIVDSFIENFKTLTLEKYIEKEYGELGKDVCIALEHEVNEFYNIYKDDIEERDGDLFSKSEGLLLEDAISGYAPLFSNREIDRLVTKIYNKELKL